MLISHDNMHWEYWIIDTIGNAYHYIIFNRRIIIQVKQHLVGIYPNVSKCIKD